MDGILIIDKPAGLTSHDVVARVRRILKTRRVGHTGTLDPFATGVMVILAGQATRLAQFLDKDEKEYEALVRFGFETDTGDVTGSPKSKVQGPKSLSLEDVRAVLGDFRGEIEQTPPMYSAKKIDGKKLYELARKGETVVRKPVRVNISNLEAGNGNPNDGNSGLSAGTAGTLACKAGSSGLTDPVVDQLATEQNANAHQAGGTGVNSFTGEGACVTGDTVTLRVTCSAGTYIRTLAEDIARRAGTLAHLEELRRIRAGRFTIAQSLTLEQLAELPEPASALIPMEQAVAHLPGLELTDERIAKTRNGLSTRVRDANFVDGEAVKMADSGGRLVAVGRYDAEENIVQPKVVLV